MPTVPVEGCDVHYHETGSGSSLTLLCLHGAGGNHTVWLDAMDRLAPDQKAIAIDLPGHGASKGKASRSISGYATQVKSFVDTLGLPPLVLCGHSMGGGIAIEYGLRNPGDLAGLVLVATGAKLRVAPAILDLLERSAKEGVKLGLDQWAFAPDAPQEIVDRYSKGVSTTDPWVRLDDMKACDVFDRLADTRRLTLPTLVMAGEHDRLTPTKYSEYLAREIPGAQLVLDDTAGHMVMLERPEAFAASVSEFLGRL